MNPYETAAWLAFAGRAFLRPDIDRLQESLKELDSVDEEPARSKLEQALTEAGDSIRTEYVRLFLDPRGAPCAPWQSARGPDGRLMAQAHLSALAWYRRFGFAPSLDNEPADHVGLLLLFASYLISQQEKDSLSSFAAEHLGWIPSFCELVSAGARLDFYRLVADHTARVCAQLVPANQTQAAVEA